MNQRIDNSKRLYRQIVVEDGYRLKQIGFVPDIIIDIGANVGVFSKYAHKTFPRALVYSVEPDKENFKELSKIKGIKAENAALGNSGSVVYHKNDSSGICSHEVYLTQSKAYPENLLAVLDNYKRVGTEALSFRSIWLYVFGYIIGAKLGSGKIFLKCDCEGAENTIFENDVDFDYLKQMDFIAMEVHYYSLTHELNAEVRKLISERIVELSKTHDIVLNPTMLFARKK